MNDDQPRLWEHVCSHCKQHGWHTRDCPLVQPCPPDRVREILLAHDGEEPSVDEIDAALIVNAELVSEVYALRIRLAELTDNRSVFEKLDNTGIA